MARIKSADEIQQLRAVIKVIGLGLSVLALLFAFRPKRFWAAESSPNSIEGSRAELNQADAALRKRIEQAAGILKGLDQRARFATQAVPQAAPVLDPFSGLLMTKPPKHDGITGGLFWRLSAVHWQLGQAAKQPANSPVSIGGLPVDPAAAAQIQAVKTLALTHSIHDDILKLGKSADEGLGKASKTLWGRNEKDPALKLDAFRRESAAQLKKAAYLLEEGLKARAEAQKSCLLSLGKPGMGKGGKAGIPATASKGRASAAKGGDSGNGSGSKGARSPSHRGGEAGRSGLSPAIITRAEIRGREEKAAMIATGPRALSANAADNCSAVRELEFALCAKLDPVSERIRCRADSDKRFRKCLDAGGQPPQPPSPPACQGVMVSGKCQACPAGQKPKTGGGCGPTCGGKLFDPAKTCCVGKSVVPLTKGKCTPKCGKNTYNPKAACCSAEGKLLANHIADSAGRCTPACGGKAYDKTKACCSVGKVLTGQLEIVPDKCGPPCGNAGHDPKKSVCCGSKPFDKAKFCCDGGKPLESQIKDLGQCAKRHQNSTPKPNGCGDLRLPSELLRKIVDLNNPAGEVNTSFLLACNQHDRCYGTCNAKGSQADAQLKKECDDTFQKDMAKACAKEQDRVAKVACISYAGTYWGVVVDHGMAAYALGQQRHCRCCK